jgi:hypothetical protein
LENAFCRNSTVPRNSALSAVIDGKSVMTMIGITR